MAEVLVPRDTADLVEAIAQALRDDHPLELIGGGSKRGFGRPVEGARPLSLAGFHGVVAYEPGELVLTAAAATPMAEITAMLAQSNQQLAFEPPDLGPLYGAPADAATLGGVVACNLAGPRRLVAGAARDHVLGFAAVNGRAEMFKAGGKVVKNVTGYDLSKLIAGSFGTLAAITELSVKVLPRPETERTVALPDLADGPALASLRAALGTAHDVSAAAHLPAAAARTLGFDGAVSLARIEGFAPSVAVRVEAIVTAWRALANPMVLEAEKSRVVWRDIGAAAPLVAAPDRAAWRVSVPPTEGAGVVAALGDAVKLHWYDWAGGLVWLGVPPEGDAGAAAIRAAAARAGGHATLMRAAPSVRSREGVFHPQSPALAGLEARVKAAFDPRGLLNPGRMG